MNNPRLLIHLQQLKRSTSSSSASAGGTTNLAGGGTIVLLQLLSNRVDVGKSPHGTPVDSGRHVDHKKGANKTVVAQPASLATQPPPPPPVRSIYEYSDELNAELEKEFQERNRLLSEECENLQLTNRYPPNPWEFFVSPGHGIVWCPVFKAASSIWLYYFNILGGYNVDFLQRTKMPPLELARKKFPRPTAEELADARRRKQEQDEAVTMLCRTP